LKRLILVSLFIFFLWHTVGLAQERTLHVMINTTETNESFVVSQYYLASDRYYIQIRTITETLGLKVSWDHKKREYSIHQLNGMKLSAKLDDTTWHINGLPYYCIDQAFLANGNKTYAPIRMILEPMYQIQFEREEYGDTIIATENQFYNRIKILTESSEIIINYELHKLKNGFIQQDHEVFVSLREFIVLMEGRITYNVTSEYDSPEIIIQPANTNHEIKLYPKIDKAILIHHDSEERKEVILTKKIMNRNGSYFIGINDLITVLQAERHSYLDSNVNTYFNFEF